MMRPAPGQNYPRTGFPLEGRNPPAAAGDAAPQPGGAACPGPASLLERRSVEDLRTQKTGNSVYNENMDKHKNVSSLEDK